MNFFLIEGYKEAAISFCKESGIKRNWLIIVEDSEM